jgi:hypothetical protein
MNKVDIALTKMLMSTDPATVADACAVKCLRLVETSAVATAATDGVLLLYNPEFVDGLTVAQVCGLLVHEICHVRFGHTERFREHTGLSHPRANRSMDREINPIVAAAGYELPPDGCWPAQIGQPNGLAWEAYYPHEDDAPARGDRTPDGCHAAGGLVADFAPDLLDDETTPAAVAKDIAQQVKDAADGSRIAGPHKPGRSAGQTVLQGGELVLVTGCRWQDAVIDLMASRVGSESVADWSRPSRRSIASGVYRPARRRVGGYRLALVLDVSGSCVGFFQHWQAMAREMVEALPQITELEIVYHDTRVTGRGRWDRRDGDEIKLASRAGGGTCFCDALAEVESMDVDGAILFTDSEGTFPRSFAVEAVTVQPPGSTGKTPFGKTIRITTW